MVSRSRTVTAAGLVLAGVLALLSACAPGATQPGHEAQQGMAGLQVRLNADMFQFSSASQFCQTLVTAEVVVGGHGPARWNTPDGKLPAGISTHAAVINGNYRIYTPVTFTRFVPLVDHRDIATKEFFTLGGQVGQDRYSIDEVPTLPGTGGHYVVVLYPSTPQSGGNTEMSLVVGNAYPVDSQGMVILQQASNPNEPGVGPVQPASTIALESLKQQLAACHP